MITALGVPFLRLEHEPATAVQPDFATALASHRVVDAMYASAGTGALARVPG